MRTRLIVFACLLCIAANTTNAQLSGRSLGAHSFEVDDGTGSGKTLRWDVLGPLSNSYQLHFPKNPPANSGNYLFADLNGNMSWASNTLPTLPEGNIWCGNSSNVAWPMPPTTPGSILALDGSNRPEWTNSLPGNFTISASQITTGTLQPGVTIDVGNNASIIPYGNGIVAANQLTGSGPNKYSGSAPIAQNTIGLSVNYSAITASSTVLVSIIDASGQTAQASVGQITPGVGFNVTFSGYYPTTTGSLNYIVVN